MDKDFTTQFRFPTTEWSLLTRASAPAPKTRAPALEKLCRIYWPPLYAFVRSKGIPHAEAEDLTQSFVSEVIALGQLKHVEADRGRLRNYLLGGISKHMAKQWRDDHRQKRGGHTHIVSLDHSAASEQHRILDLTVDQTPESSFERQWALTVIEQSLSEIARDYETRGQSDIFEALKFAITPGEEHRRYQDVATQTGLSVTAVTARIFRLRERFVRQLRKTVADTLTDPKEIDDEIRRLMAVFK